jgi:hypothetical protein
MTMPRRTVRFPRAAAAAAAAASALLFGAQAADAEESLLGTLDSLVAALSTQATQSFASLERQLRSLDPTLIRSAAPIVAGLIEESRDEAIAHGVEPIPQAIREELEGYVPKTVLDRARWCSGCGGTLSLQQNTFRLGFAPAITLDYVIVFERRDDALTDPSLWVHELKHVMQYEDWGVAGFASRYLEDYAAVEREAAEYRWEWVKRTDWLERRKSRRAATTS